MRSYNIILFFILTLFEITSKADKIWLGNIKGYNKNDAKNGYAGIIGRDITGLKVSGGKPYRVHIKGGKWLGEITGNNKNEPSNGYAGTIKGNAIDAIAVKGVSSYTVHIKGGKWLRAVNGYNINDPNNGYAGVLGKAIDAIMIKGRTYAVSINTGSTTSSNSSSGGSSSTVSNNLENKIKIIYNYITSNVPGATKKGIAAVLGNWKVESGIEPKRAEADYVNPPIGAKSKSDPCWDDDKWLSMTGPQIYNGRFPKILKRGLGLGQWTDTKGSPRNTNLRKYAKSKGKKWYDLTLQLDFMLHGDNSYSIKQIKNVLTSNDSVNTLTTRFLKNWEGNSGDKVSQRQKSANEMYNYLVKHF